MGKKVNSHSLHTVMDTTTNSDLTFIKHWGHQLDLTWSIKVCSKLYVPHLYLPHQGSRWVYTIWAPSVYITIRVYLYVPLLVPSACTPSGPHLYIPVWGQMGYIQVDPDVYISLSRYICMSPSGPQLYIPLSVSTCMYPIWVLYIHPLRPICMYTIRAPPACTSPGSICMYPISTSSVCTPPGSPPLYYSFRWDSFSALKMQPDWWPLTLLCDQPFWGALSALIHPPFSDKSVAKINSW